MQNTTNKQTNLKTPPPPPPIGISPSPVWASAGKKKKKKKKRGGWGVGLRSSESQVVLRVCSLSQKDRLPWMGIRLRLGMTRRCSLTHLGSSPEGQIANGRRVHVTETAGPAGYGRQAENAGQITAEKTPNKPQQQNTQHPRKIHHWTNHRPENVT